MSELTMCEVGTRKRSQTSHSRSFASLIQNEKRSAGSSGSLASSNGDSDTTVESIDSMGSSSGDEEDEDRYKSFDDEFPVAEDEIDEVEGGLRKRARRVLDDVFSLEFDYALGAGFDIEQSPPASLDDSDVPLSTGPGTGTWRTIPSEMVFLRYQ